MTRYKAYQSGEWEWTVELITGFWWWKKTWQRIATISESWRQTKVADVKTAWAARWLDDPDGDDIMGSCDGAYQALRRVMPVLNPSAPKRSPWKFVPRAKKLPQARLLKGEELNTLND